LFSGTAFAELLDTTLPADFPTIKNDYLGVPVIGFGARGRIDRVPVIFLHGNNDTPFPTACNRFGYIYNAAQYFLDHGYKSSELWGLGYQGDQCDLPTEITRKSGVAPSLGVTATREWLLQDNAYHLVRSLVAIDGPNHGIINCSPSPVNYFQLPTNGGFVPSSAICDEYSSDHTQLLTVLNGAGETPGPTRYLVIRNVRRTSPGSGDFVFVSSPDGHLPAVPAEDRGGKAHVFSNSAVLGGTPSIDLVGQGQYDQVLGTSHLGIVNSPQTWQSALEFLGKLSDAQ